MHQKIILLLIALGTCQHYAAGQRRKPAAAPAKDTIRTNTIEVIQSYKPEIRPAPKPAFSPALPPADTSRVKLQYEVPAQTLDFTYRARPLKPLALGRDTAALPYQNYLKMGGGNLSTFYLDGGLGSLRGESYETDIQLRHISQKGNIRYQESMLSSLDATGKLRTGGHELRLDLSALRNSFNLYGMDPFYPPSAARPSSTLGGVQLSAVLTPSDQQEGAIRYSPKAGISLFTGNQLSSSRGISLHAPFSRQIDSSLTVHLGVSGDFNRLESNNETAQAGLVSITPGVSIQRRFFSADLFINPTFGNRGVTYLLPDLTASLRTSGNQFILRGGWKARLQQQSYERFFHSNPFLWLTPANVPGLLAQTREDEVFAQVESGIGNHLSLSGRVSWWQFSNLPLFINDPLDYKRFDILYDPRVNAVSFQADAQYRIGQTLSLGFSGAWFNYYQSTETSVWHLPGIRLRGDVLITPIPDLTITAYVLMMDRIYARDVSGRTIKLKSFADIGTGAEYNIIPRLSVFAHANNLLNLRYQQWSGYAAYGFNIFGGLRLKF